jgi:diphosphomevalonate decarboxylase
MPRLATARAHSNIALCKYWGKLAVPPRADESGLGYRLRSLNCPATPSISLALAALSTETTAEALGDGAREDVFELDGQPATPAAHDRLVDYLDLWREAGLLAGRFRVASANNFPTAAGLASSASAYAALATALNALADEPVDRIDLSRWARRGSGSASRSIPGGLAAMEAAIDAPAYLALAAGELPWTMAVCIVDAPPKDVPSRSGMQHSRDSSPFYSAWLEEAQADFETVIEALWHLRHRSAEPDEVFASIGEVAEANCVAMHAVMQTTDPPLLYWSPATLAVIHAVRAWRVDGGPLAYFTIDAGPHVCLLCLQDDLAEVTRRAAAVPGVQRVIPSHPGGPAEIISLE